MARKLKVGSAPLVLPPVADPLLATLAQASGHHVRTGTLPMAMPCWGDAALPCGHPVWEGRAFGHQHWHPGEVAALGQRGQDPPPALPELPGACRKQTFLPPSHHAANSISARERPCLLSKALIYNLLLLSPRNSRRCLLRACWIARMVPRGAELLLELTGRSRRASLLGSNNTKLGF